MRAVIWEEPGKLSVTEAADDLKAERARIAAVQRSGRRRSASPCRSRFIRPTLCP